MVLEVDLNVPPCESYNEVGTSSHTPVAVELQIGRQASHQHPVTIDIDSPDDDVILSSPRAFAEAKNNFRRNRARSYVVDVDLVESDGRHVANNCNKRQRAPTNQPIINCESYINLEMSGLDVSGSGESLREKPRSMVPPFAPPQESTFSCPVCMGQLVEETSTKCGHIFCKACIKQAIATQGKCPTCRRRVTMKDAIRIYLPATNST